MRVGRRGPAWTRARRRPPRPLALLGVAVAATAVAAGAMAVGATEPAERLAVDARFDVRGARPAPASVAVVAIDDRTLATLQVQFPFARTLHAQVVRRLTADRVRAIAYDVQFTEPTTARADNALFDALAAAPGVVLATTETQNGATNLFGGDDRVRAMGARAGHVAIPTDGGGVVRRFHRSYDGLIGLPLAVAETVTGRPVDTARFDGDGEAWIDFAGPPRTVPTYAFVDVLEGRVPADRLRGRIVVVGAGAPELGDAHPTATTSSDASLMPGPEILANAIDTILRGFPLRDAPAWVGVLLVLAGGCVVPLVALRVRPGAVTLVAVAMAVALAGTAYLAFRAGWVVPVAGPALALLLSTFGALLAAAFYAALERERTRTLFARFVDAPVVDELLGRSDGTVRLGGVEVDASVLFCDLRGSTALFETLGPERGIAVLNHFLSAMADAVLDHGGTLIGYRGDGLVALFGAPIAHPDHADRAVAVARDMAGPRLNGVNAWLAADGPPVAPLRLGVGIDSGRVLAGNVGSELRMEYTAVGDPANVAARVEGLTKELGHPVLLTAATVAALSRPAPDLVDAGAHAVRGRAAPVTLWALG